MFDIFQTRVSYSHNHINKGFFFKVRVNYITTLIYGYIMFVDLTHGSEQAFQYVTEPIRKHCTKWLLNY